MTNECHVYSISTHINKSLKEFYDSGKPEWAAPETIKRVVRYAQAYAKNAAFIHMINKIGNPEHAIVRDLQ